MGNKIIAFILVLILVNLGFPQNKISLLDTEKVNEYLELTPKQIKIINPKIEQIKTILPDF